MLAFSDRLPSYPWPTHLLIYNWWSHRNWSSYSKCILVLSLYTVTYIHVHICWHDSWVMHTCMYMQTLHTHVHAHTLHTHTQPFESTPIGTKYESPHVCTFGEGGGGKIMSLLPHLPRVPEPLLFLSSHPCLMASCFISKNISTSSLMMDQRRFHPKPRFWPWTSQNKHTKRILDSLSP